MGLNVTAYDDGSSPQADRGAAGTTATVSGPAAPREHPGLVLAVDGGNSKTDVALATADGEVLAQAQAGPFTPQSTGVGSAIDVVAKAVGEIRTRLELPEDAPLARHLSAFVAGADLPQEEVALAEAFAAQRLDRDGRGRQRHLRPAARRGLASLGCRGGLRRGHELRGHRSGRTARALSGDRHPDRRLGRRPRPRQRAMYAAVRGEDGRGDPTALTEAVAAHFGTETAIEAALGFHLGSIAGDRIHELSPLLLRVATAGDQVALEYVDKQAREVVGWARTTLDKLDLLDRETEVILGGGVLRAAVPVLMDRIAALAATRIPAARLVVPTRRPIHGAVLLGLDRLGVTPAT